MIKYKGEYHGFFAEWWGDCGVNSWTTSSHVVHATSDTAAGPFTYRDVSLGCEATNPHVMYDNRSDVFTIFHLGDATGGGCSDRCSGETTTWVRAQGRRLYSVALCCRH